jgi:hypothetical protein
MAACLISVTGTYGILRIDYNISGYFYNIETSIGEFYIDDTATDVTYTTLSGDLIASSLCLTITELPLECYNIYWGGLAFLENYVITDLLFDSAAISVPEINIERANYNLISYVNGLNNSAVKIIASKNIYSSFPIQGCSTCSIRCNNQSFIFKILGLGNPSLKIKNVVTNTYLIIPGVSSSCSLDSSYDTVNVCYGVTSPSTTTTTTTLLL